MFIEYLHQFIKINLGINEPRPIQAPLEISGVVEDLLKGPLVYFEDPYCLLILSTKLPLENYIVI